MGSAVQLSILILKNEDIFIKNLDTGFSTKDETSETIVRNLYRPLQAQTHFIKYSIEGKNHLSSSKSSYFLILSRLYSPLFVGDTVWKFQVYLY